MTEKSPATKPQQPEEKAAVDPLEALAKATDARIGDLERTVNKAMSTITAMADSQMAIEQQQQQLSQQQLAPQRPGAVPDPNADVAQPGPLGWPADMRRQPGTPSPSGDPTLDMVVAIIDRHVAAVRPGTSAAACATEVLANLQQVGGPVR